MRIQKPRRCGDGRGSPCSLALPTLSGFATTSSMRPLSAASLTRAAYCSPSLVADARRVEKKLGESVGSFSSGCQLSSKSASISTRRPMVFHSSCVFQRPSTLTTSRAETGPLSPGSRRARVKVLGGSSAPLMSGCIAWSLPRATGDGGWYVSTKADTADCAPKMTSSANSGCMVVHAGCLIVFRCRGRGARRQQTSSSSSQPSR